MGESRPRESVAAAVKKRSVSSCGVKVPLSSQTPLDAKWCLTPGCAEIVYIRQKAHQYSAVTPTGFVPVSGTDRCQGQHRARSATFFPHHGPSSRSRRPARHLAHYLRPIVSFHHVPVPSTGTWPVRPETASEQAPLKGGCLSRLVPTQCLFQTNKNASAWRRKLLVVAA